MDGLGVNAFELPGEESVGSVADASRRDAGVEQGEEGREFTVRSTMVLYRYTHDCMFTNCLILSTNRYRAHFSCPRAASCRFPTCQLTRPNDRHPLWSIRMTLASPDTVDSFPASPPNHSPRLVDSTRRGSPKDTYIPLGISRLSKSKGLISRKDGRKTWRGLDEGVSQPKAFSVVERTRRNRKLN